MESTGPTMMHLTQKILAREPRTVSWRQRSEGSQSFEKCVSTERSADSLLVSRRDREQDRSGPVLLTGNRREESSQGKQTQGLIGSDRR